MGASDLAERDLYQGLIKLAAAFVHAARRNPRGVAKNLEGARERLGDAVDAGRDAGIDVPRLLEEIDGLAAAADAADAPSIPRL